MADEKCKRNANILARFRQRRKVKKYKLSGIIRKLEV